MSWQQQLPRCEQAEGGMPVYTASRHKGNRLHMLTHSVSTKITDYVYSYKVSLQEQQAVYIHTKCCHKENCYACSHKVSSQELQALYAHQVSSQGKQAIMLTKNRLVCTQRVSPQGKKATYLTNSVITRRTDCMLIKIVVHLHKVSSQGDLVHTNYYRNDSRICMLTGDFEDREILSANNNNNVHLSCAHQRPERSHDTY